MQHASDLHQSLEWSERRLGDQLRQMQSLRYRTKTRNRALFAQYVEGRILAGLRQADVMLVPERAEYLRRLAASVAETIRHMPFR